MKKIILLALTALIVMGCDGIQRNYDGSVILLKQKSIDNPFLEVIDSCEYIVWHNRLAHKGNCSFCKERRQKELEKLVEQLKVK